MLMGKKYNHNHSMYCLSKFRRDLEAAGSLLLPCFQHRRPENVAYLYADSVN
jgi:hypothetical protein